MDALASGGLHEGGQAQAFQPLPNAPGRLDHRIPRHRGVRIEVEDQPVRLLELVDRRVPGVDLEDPDLGQADEARAPRAHVDVGLEIDHVREHRQCRDHQGNHDHRRDGTEDSPPRPVAPHKGDAVGPGREEESPHDQG